MPTRWGIYFVPEELASLRALIRSGALEATDLLCNHRLFKSCLRSLFLLAAEEALTSDGDDTVRRLVGQLRLVSNGIRCRAPSCQPQRAYPKGAVTF